MKALSLTPPWPGAILNLGKRIENRVKWRGCSYRGPILLHAAKGIGTRADFDDAVHAIFDIVEPSDAGAFEEELGVFFSDAKGLFVPTPKMLRAGIVGRANIVGVIDPSRLHRGHPASEAFDNWVRYGGDPDQRKWWFGGFALVLADVEPLPFTPWPGSLGLFEVDETKLRSA